MATSKRVRPAHAAPEPDAAEAAEARRLHYAGTDRATREVEALLVERRGYVVRGMGDRVAQVDEQILLRGGTPPTDED